MPLARIGNKVLYFAHVPKTGGTSIESYLAAKGAVALRHPRKLGWSASTPQHMPAEVRRAFVPGDFYDFGFGVLRDPVDRLVSAYKMRVKAGPGINPINLPLRGLGRLRGRATRRVSFPPFALELDFDRWLRLALARSARQPNLYDGHLRPQTAFLLPGDRRFRFEDGLGPVMRWIDEVTATPPIAGSFHEKRSAPMEVPVSARSRETIRAVYAADYAELARLEGASSG